MDRNTFGRLAGCPGPGTEVTEEASGGGALIVQTRGQAGGIGNRPPSAIAYFRRSRVEAGGVAGKAGSRPGVEFGSGNRSLAGSEAVRAAAATNACSTGTCIIR
jgi:hypothetical protein